MVGLARWLAKAEQHTQALTLYRRAIAKGLADDLLFRTLWDVALIEKRQGEMATALGLFHDLAADPNPYRLPALLELAKHHEHRERNYTKALEYTRTALGVEDTPELRHREARLERRLTSRRLI